MSGGWLISYLALWTLVVVIAFLLLGALRQLGLERRGHSNGRDWMSGIPAYENDGPEIGSNVPHMTVETGNGAGSVVLNEWMSQSGGLVVFMSVFCEGCQDVAGPLRELVGETAGTLRSIAILQGTDAACRAFLKLYPLGMATVFDKGDAIKQEFDVHHSPYGLLYGPGGTLIGKGSIDTLENLRILVGHKRAMAPIQGEARPV